LWSAFSDRVRREVGSSEAHDALIWALLIAALGLYGWYATGIRQDVEVASVADESRVDAVLQRAASEKAALEHQIAEASARIAALEETLKAERRQGGAAPPAPLVAPAPPRAISSLAAELGGRETERGILLDLTDSDLSFPIGKATLPDRDFPVLDRLATLLTQHQTLTARVEGHTDSAGRDEVNLALSQERADAVKQALVERGASAQRIEAVGYGESRPIADNGTRAGRDRNRRIEVYLIEEAN
jgi:outer membrane protein OmpA-like peptidoglycan-associated protein